MSGLWEQVRRVRLGTGSGQASPESRRHLSQRHWVLPGSRGRARQRPETLEGSALHASQQRASAQARGLFSVPNPTRMLGPGRGPRCRGSSSLAWPGSRGRRGPPSAHRPPASFRKAWWRAQSTLLPGAGRLLPNTRPAAAGVGARGRRAHRRDLPAGRARLLPGPGRLRSRSPSPVSGSRRAVVRGSRVRIWVCGFPRQPCPAGEDAGPRLPCRLSLGAGGSGPDGGHRSRQHGHRAARPAPAPRHPLSLGAPSPLSPRPRRRGRGRGRGGLGTAACAPDAATRLPAAY